MLERAKIVTRYERWTAVEYARFADGAGDPGGCAPMSAMASWCGREAASGGVDRTTGKKPEGGPSRRREFWDFSVLSSVGSPVARADGCRCKRQKVKSGRP